MDGKGLEKLHKLSSLRTGNGVYLNILRNTRKADEDRYHRVTGKVGQRIFKILVGVF